MHRFWRGSDKPTPWGHILVLCLVLVAILVIDHAGRSQLLPLLQYDGTFHRNLLGIATGGLATVFALVSSTAVLLFQQIAAHSPTSLRFFPTTKVITVTAGLAILLVADGLLLLVKGEPGLALVVATNLVLLLHPLAAFSVVWLVSRSVEWLDPHYVLKNVTLQAASVTTSDQRYWVVDALSELSSNLPARGYSSYMKPMIRGYEVAIATHPGVILTEGAPPEIAPSSYRLISSVGHMVVRLADHHLDSFVSDTAPLFVALLIDKKFILVEDLRSRIVKKVRRLIGANLAGGQDHAVASFLRRLGEELRSSPACPSASLQYDLYLPWLSCAVEQKNLLATVTILELLLRLYVDSPNEADVLQRLLHRAVQVVERAQLPSYVIAVEEADLDAAIRRINEVLGTGSLRQHA